MCVDLFANLAECDLYLFTLYTQTQLANDLNPIRRLATLADAAAENNQEEEDIEKGTAAAEPSESFPMQNRTSVTVEDESGGGGGGGAAESNGTRLWKTSVDLGSAMGSGSFEVCAAAADAAATTAAAGDGGGGDFSHQRRLHGYLYSGVEVDVCGNESEGGGGGGGGETTKVHQCQV